MKARLFYLAVVIFFAFAGYAYALSCDISPTCSDTILMRISDTAGGHAELGGQTHYNNLVCCSDSLSLGTSCSGTYTEVLLLSSVTNAHAELPAYSHYSFPVCLSTGGASVACMNDTTCVAPYTCIASISADTNAHVADCSVYQTKICCKTNDFPNNPPVLTSVTATPQYVHLGTPVNVTSVASDPDPGSTIRLECGWSPGTYNLCTGQYVSQNPSCTFNSTWTDDGTKTIYCIVYDGSLRSIERTTTTTSDNTPPTIGSMTSAPAEVGANTVVTYTGVGFYDAIGLDRAEIYVNGLLKQTCHAPLTTCEYSEDGYDPGILVNFTGRVYDLAGNFGQRSGSLQLCSFDSVLLIPSCGADGICSTGETISVNAQFHGLCPLSDLTIQVDANSSDCSITALGGDMSGITIANTSVGVWTVPAIPPACEGDTIFATDAAIWKGPVDPTHPENWFAGANPTGSFTLAAPDRQPPGVNVRYAPITIGTLTGVLLYANSSDPSGITNTSIYASDNGAPFVSVCYSTTSTCAFNSTFATGHNITFYAVAYDTYGNRGTSSIESFDVCSLDSVSVSPNCGIDGCTSGETITINAAYSGACPAAPTIWVDASGQTCHIQQSGGDITGMSISCLSSPCSKTWTVPTIPFRCEGQTMVAAGASIRNAANDWYGSSGASGQFMFTLNMNGITFPINLSLSDYTPNYRYVLFASINCTVARGVDRVICSPDTTHVNNLRIDNVTTGIVPLWNSSTSKWEATINTAVYHSVVNATAVYLGQLQNSSFASYIVNMPPEIRNAAATPASPPIGSTVTFSANVTDPEGDAISRVYACLNTNCAYDPAGRYCEMTSTSGSGYSCQHIVAASDSIFYVFASDIKDAWNNTAGIALLPGQFEIHLGVEFPDNATFLPLTPEPNFTKGMPMNFRANAGVFRITTGEHVDECAEDTCTLSYKVDSGSYTDMQWNGFTSSWAATRPTAGLECDQYHTLTIQARRDDGLTGITNVPIFVNCVPLFTVVPAEARYALGAVDQDAFTVMMVNPLDTTARYTVTLDTAPNNEVTSWIGFQCISGGCGFPDNSTDDKVSFAIAAESSESALVHLSIAARAGNYPVHFTAVPDGPGQSYEATALLGIFAEALPEFEIWQLFVAILIAGAVYAVVKRKKK